MNKPKEFCPCCGQAYMRNTHTFSRSLAQILLRVSRDNKEGWGFHLQKDMILTTNQNANFQKLQYWGLVEKHYEGGKRRGGYWHLTGKVKYILSGHEIPKSVTTFNNKVVEVSKETTYLKEVIGFYEIPNVWAKRATPETAAQMEMFK